MSCTTVLVGKNASNDGSTMIARTDDGHFDVKKMTVVKPKDQPRKYTSKISHVTIELPDNPMRYTSCPSVDLKNGIWAATGINEVNVGTQVPGTFSERIAGVGESEGGTAGNRYVPVGAAVAVPSLQAAAHGSCGGG